MLCLLVRCRERSGPTVRNGPDPGRTLANGPGPGRTSCILLSRSMLWCPVPTMSRTPRMLGFLVHQCRGRWVSCVLPPRSLLGFPVPTITISRTPRMLCFLVHPCLGRWTRSMEVSGYPTLYYIFVDCASARYQVGFLYFNYLLSLCLCIPTPTLSDIITVKILVLYLIRKDLSTTVPVVNTKLQNTIHRC